MDHRHVAVFLAATLCVAAVHEGGRGAAARPLGRPGQREAVLDVAAAEAPEGGAGLSGGGEAAAVLGAGKWLPMPMPLTLPAASGLRFPLFPGGGASMPWLPGAPPALAGLPALVPPYVGATRQEQLSLWASLFNPMQVRPRLPASTLGVGVGEKTGGQVVDREGGPAIASAGKAVETSTDVPAAGAVQGGEPRWGGVFLGNMDRRN